MIFRLKSPSFSLPNHEHVVKNKPPSTGKFQQPPAPLTHTHTHTLPLCQNILTKNQLPAENVRQVSLFLFMASSYAVNQG